MSSVRKPVNDDGGYTTRYIGDFENPIGNPYQSTSIMELQRGFEHCSSSKSSLSGGNTHESARVDYVGLT